MQWMRFANVVVFVINIALFALWWSLIRVDAAPDGELAEYVYSQLGLQVTVLGVIIGVAALVLAGLGFIGFQTVLERSERMADKTAREVVASLVDGGELGEPIGKPRPSGGLPDVGKTEEARD